jgi:alpha-amylase/alpha-mannosidase (GH57 family)
VAPILFAFGVHDHQPVGNFDHVIEQHVREAYRPFLERLTERGFVPITLHVSGPLLEWLEAHDRPFLDFVGRLAADGKIELLLSGYDEPILASLPRADRVEQVARMREELRRLFGAGIRAEGLWLTERVWEPDLAADLAEAGVRYCLVDDRHFLVSAIAKERLHAPWWTEADGRKLALFPIDERLRYLVPFKPPAQVLGYLEHLRAAGHRLAVLADDGEKYGGWPGTRAWVYERGWLTEFLDVMLGAMGRGDVQLVTFSDALAEVPSGGLAYVP